MNGNFDLYNNVRIIKYNSKHELKSIIDVHNKANATLIQGILKFLRGEFTPSNITNNIITHNPSDAKLYIPSYMNFGNGGLSIVNEQIINNVQPTSFYDNILQNELINSELGRLPVSKSEVGTSNGNDSGILRITTYVPEGYYTKIGAGTHNGIAYLTELGLFANNFSGSAGVTSKLLARVTFDTPIQQQSDEIILVQWSIGAISINDGAWTQTMKTNENWTWET